MNKKIFILSIVIGIILVINILYLSLNKKNDNKFSINKELTYLNLTTNQGIHLKTEEVLGSPSIFFFGFLNCPDICPNTLMKISEIITKLGDKSKKVNFYFVTVDPERDKVDDMNKYLTNFSKEIIGVTGSPNNIKKFLKTMHVYYEKIYLDENFYTLDHSSQIFIFKKKGDFFGTISLEEDELIVLKKIKSII
tara:strand:- start:388 stop:969 length:582 start_codon:yes stop_codon:yes gene_type:complete